MSDELERTRKVEEGTLIEGWTPEDLLHAHEHSSRNRTFLQQSDQIGCFHCMRHPIALEKVREWTDTKPIPTTRMRVEPFVARRFRKDPEATTDPTAICPHCGIDSLLGDASCKVIGVTFDKKFLDAMWTRWFKPDDDLLWEEHDH